jgi:hypothetical protein
VTDAPRPHPERFEDFKVGDRVWCLAWIGREFEVAATDPASQRIELQGCERSSLPEGAQVDIDAASLFLLTHNLWDSIWYWPDRAGETYQQVFDRFVADHAEGAVLTGYYANGAHLPPAPDPALAATFRVSFAALDAWNQVFVQPVAAIADGGGALITAHDTMLADERWLQCGPTITVRVEMHYYRWAVMAGRVLLNWRDIVAN